MQAGIGVGRTLKGCVPAEQTDTTLWKSLQECGSVPSLLGGAHAAVSGLLWEYRDSVLLSECFVGKQWLLRRCRRA